MAGSIIHGKVGRTEMSFGAGRFAEPKSDFQSQRNLPWAQGEDKRDNMLRQQSEARTDPTNSAERIEDMPYVLGNPDMYGPDQPLIQEKVVRPSRLKKQPVLRYGVDRQA